MPKPYNYAQLYHRTDNVRAIAESSDVDPQDTRPVGAVVSYEQYCAAIGVDVRAARRASLLSSLAEYMADDPIARMLKQAKPLQASYEAASASPVLPWFTVPADPAH